MKRFILLMILTIPFALAEDLSDYPYLFIEDDQFDGLLVVGETAPAIHTIAITNIALGLQRASLSERMVCPDETFVPEDCEVSSVINPIPNTVHKFDTEISDPTAYNIISVGGPCVNSVSAALLGNPIDCYEGFDADKGYLILLENGNSYQLIVHAPLDSDINDLSRILQNFEDYDLDDMYMEFNMLSLPEPIPEPQPEPIPDGATIWMVVDEQITTANGDLKLLDVVNHEQTCGIQFSGSAAWIDVGDCMTLHGTEFCVLDANEVYLKNYESYICKLTFESEIIEEEPEEEEEEPVEEEPEEEEEEPVEEEPEDEEPVVCEEDDDCNDGNVDTADRCMYNKCHYLERTCGLSDDACPSNCQYPADKDCNECISNSDCDDSDPTTIDSCDGSPTRCWNSIITYCVSGDFYCPNSCVYPDDED